jgi:hypothetical protein
LHGIATGHRLVNLKVHTLISLSLFLAGGKAKKSAKKREREDGEPALPDSPTTPEQSLDNDESAPDDIKTTPQVVEQPADSSNEMVDSGRTLEDVPELEQKGDVNRSPEADLNTANEGADSSTPASEDATGSEQTIAKDDPSTLRQTEGGQDAASEEIAESADSKVAAGNVSTEDNRTGKSERESQVLNDVPAMSSRQQSQDASEESHDEL